MNVFTVDVEDWYHGLVPEPSRWGACEARVVAPTRRLMEMLEAAGTRGTFFVLGHVAERHPGLVREIAERGHEVGSHGWFHRFVNQGSRAQFVEELDRSSELLERLTGSPVLGYRAPYFSIVRETLWALPALAEAGLRYDASVHPVWNPRYGIPAAPRFPFRTPEGLVELPVTTARVGRVNVPCGGGAYFRLLPYRAIRHAYRTLESRGAPIVFYIHPWELDPGHPHVPLPTAHAIRHRWGLTRTEERLARLLRDFRFGPAQALATRVAAAPTIDLRRYV